MASEDPSALPLHERNPTGRFSERADEYARFRPSYPPDAIDALLADLGDPAKLAAADVGAGTGISSRLLADRGVRVFAVEPNAAMREAAEPYPLVTWIDGAAEATSLPNRSVDLVLCAQAFHWFRHDDALAEFHRVLRPRGGGGGRLALLWNDDDPNDPVIRGYRDAVSRAAARDWTAKNPFHPGRLESTGLFTRPREVYLAHTQSLTLDGLIGRARSASYVPREGPRHDQLVKDLTSLHARFAGSDGLIRLGYQVRLYISGAIVREAWRPHEENPTGRFTGRAADYARYRHSYPPRLTEVVFDGMGDPAASALTVADIGAGTGISSRFLADSGARVIAVEPNAEMRAAAEPHKRVEWRDAPAERTGLPDVSVDIVVCCQSFHWFRRLDALVEFHRILRPGGRLALVWREWWRKDPFTRALDDAVIESAEFNIALGEHVRPADLVASGLFHRARERFIEDTCPVSLDHLRGLVASLSITPKDGPRHSRLMEKVQSLHAAGADASGAAVISYRTQVYLADAARFPSCAWTSSPTSDSGR